MRIQFAILSIALLVLPVSGYTYPLPYQNLEGTVVNLNYKEGDFLLMEIMTTWCESCKAQMEELRQIYNTVDGSLSMLSIGVDLTSDTLEKLSDYRMEYDANWEFGLDFKGTFEEKFNVESYPTLILLNNAGSIVKKWVGITPAETILDEVSNYLEITYSIEEGQSDNLSGSLLESMYIPVIILVGAIILTYSGHYISGLRSSRAQHQ